MFLKSIGQHKYEKGNKSFLFAPWNFQTQQKQDWICTSLKANKKSPPKSWNSLLIYWTPYIYLDQSLVYDLVVSVVTVT